MNPEWLTVEPNSNVNFEIAKSVRLINQKRFLRLLDSLAKTTCLDCAFLSETVNNLDTSRKWHPLLFMKYYELREAMLTRKKTLIVAKHGELVACFKSLDNLYIDGYWIESVEKHPWEMNYVEGLRQYDQKNIRGESVEIHSLNEDEIKFHKHNIEQAITLIKAIDPGQFNELEIFVTHIKLFKGKVLRGDTSPMGYGSMWIRIPDIHDDQVGYWIEHIIHELAHIRLESIFFHELLVLNPIEEKKFVAPIRDDLRPMRGIFHATFVLIRMKRIFERLSIAGMDIRFRDRLRLCELQLNIGLQSVFSKEARFSDSGSRIRDSFLRKRSISLL